MTRARILADYVSGGTTAAEFDYLDGVTSNIQTQMDAKLATATATSTYAPKASPTFTGTTTVSGDLVPSTPLSHRNIFINGAMTVAQRGTSDSTVNATQYADACDRMKIIMSSGGGWTITQESSGPAGFGNSYKAYSREYETLDSRRVYIDSPFEGQDLQHLKKGTAGALATTLSFWVRSTTTGTFIVQLHDHDNNRSISKSYTIDVADTWEDKTITFAGDTTGAFDNDNNKSLSMYFWLVAGDDYTSGTLNTSWNTAVNANRAVGQTDIVATKDWWITGIQWEVGSNATPFEHRSYGEELARCKRYFQQYNLPSHTGVTFNQYSTNRYRGIMTIPTMNHAPTQSFTGSGYFYGYATGGDVTSSVTLQLTEEHVHFYAEEGVTMLNGDFQLESEI